MDDKTQNINAIPEEQFIPAMDKMLSFVNFEKISGGYFAEGAIHGMDFSIDYTSANGQVKLIVWSVPDTISTGIGKLSTVYEEGYNPLTSDSKSMLTAFYEEYLRIIKITNSLYHEEIMDDDLADFGYLGENEYACGNTTTEWKKSILALNRILEKYILEEKLTKELIDNNDVEETITKI